MVMQLQLYLRRFGYRLCNALDTTGGRDVTSDSDDAIPVSGLSRGERCEATSEQLRMLDDPDQYVVRTGGIALDRLSEYNTRGVSRAKALDHSATRVDTASHQYLLRLLLRYFRVGRGAHVPDEVAPHEDDTDLLRQHWAVSEEVANLCRYVVEHRHETQSALSERERYDDAMVEYHFGRILRCHDPRAAT